MKEKAKHSFFVDGAILPEMIAASIGSHSKKTALGAHAIFLGQVRSDTVDGKVVGSIHYSAYEEMAEETIGVIREDAITMFGLGCLHIYHSRGPVAAGGICLFVFASSPHRKEAMQAVEWLVERIKNDVPVWGREVYADESHTWKINR